eukprot:363888-Chlamydomonas_euryale.AAC.12
MHIHGHGKPPRPPHRGARLPPAGLAAACQAGTSSVGVARGSPRPGRAGRFRAAWRGPPQIPNITFRAPFLRVHPGRSRAAVARRP